MVFNKKQLKRYKKVLLVRPDNIGDVVLTLPMAGVIKRYLPNTKVAFLGRSYTESVIQKSGFIDEFYNWDDLSERPVEGIRSCAADVVIHVYPDKKIVAAAHRAGIPVRVGSARRWFNCVHSNRLVWLKRKGSHLHEAQLNIRLLSALGIKCMPSRNELPKYYGWQTEDNKAFEDILAKNKSKIILHPKSQGHGCEWPIQSYYQLARLLSGKHFQVLVSGTKEEGIAIGKACPELLALPHVTDITGYCNLAEFISIIEQVDCLVASGTGPVHLAAAAGVATVGLYPPVRPINPERWGPIGKKAHVLCKEVSGNDKKYANHMAAIKPEEVRRTISSISDK